jgi:hypothetical protein
MWRTSDFSLSTVFVTQLSPFLTSFYPSLFPTLLLKTSRVEEDASRVSKFRVCYAPIAPTNSDLRADAKFSSQLLAFFIVGEYFISFFPISSLSCFLVSPFFRKVVPQPSSHVLDYPLAIFTLFSFVVLISPFVHS